MQSCKYHQIPPQSRINVEHFHHPLKYNFHPFVVNPQPQSGPSGLLFGTIICLFPEFHKNGIKQHVVFEVWLLSFRLMLSGFIHAVACINGVFLSIAE